MKEKNKKNKFVILDDHKDKWKVESVEDGKKETRNTIFLLER